MHVLDMLPAKCHAWHLTRSRSNAVDHSASVSISATSPGLALLMPDFVAMSAEGFVEGSADGDPPAGSRKSACQRSATAM